MIFLFQISEKKFLSWWICRFSLDNQHISGLSMSKWFCTKKNFFQRTTKCSKLWFISHYCCWSYFYLRPLNPCLNKGKVELKWNQPFSVIRLSAGSGELWFGLDLIFPPVISVTVEYLCCYWFLFLVHIEWRHWIFISKKNQITICIYCVNKSLFFL